MELFIMHFYKLTEAAVTPQGFVCQFPPQWGKKNIYFVL